MRFPIKVIYVAGPIAGNRDANIEEGRKAGVEIWKLGAAPLVPHLNTLGMLEKEYINGSDIYLGDMAMLQRCDAVLMLPGWEKSQGCNYEAAWAKHHNIPIFGTLPELEKWLNA